MESDRPARPRDRYSAVSVPRAARWCGPTRRRRHSGGVADVSATRAAPTRVGASGSSAGELARPIARDAKATAPLLRVAVVGCVLGHLALSLLWATLVPPFEAYDETGHFAHVQYVATNARIPPPGGVLTAWFDEAHQPPLYYWAAGLAGRALGLGGSYKPPMNPFFLRGDGEGGVNAVVHNPAAESWVGSRWASLLWLSRAVSSIFGSVAVLATYLVARRIVPRRPWLAVAAAAVAAGTPTFVFISGAANNDAAVAATGALAILAGLAWYGRDGEISAGSGREGGAQARSGSLAAAALAGVAVGAALLTKNSALPLVALVPLVAVGRWLRSRGSLVAPLLEGCAGAAACVAVAAWWYARNFVLYGRFVMDRSVADSITLQPLPPSGALSQAATSHFATALLGYTFTSYWTLFGWGNVAPPSGVALAIAAYCLVSLAGLALLLKVARIRAGLEVRWDLAWVAALVFGLLVALPLYRAVRYAAATLLPGRYLFVSLSVSSVLIALGWWAASSGLPRAARAVVRAAAAVTPACVAAVALFATVVPRYAPPLMVAAADMERDATPLHVVFGQRLELAGYRVNGTAAVGPGGYLSVTLYWKSLRSVDTSYTFSVQLVDDARAVVGHTDRLPGHGNFPTSLWRPGDEFGETFLVQMDPLAPAAPQLGHLVVNVVDFAASSQGANDFKERSVLAAADAQGRPLAQVAFADVRLGTAPTIEPPRRAAYTFDGRLAFVGSAVPARAKPGETVPVELRFQRLAPGGEAATLFSHLLDRQGKVAAQLDGQPRDAGRLYPTTLWSVGEVVPVAVRLALPPDLPAGAYQLEWGFYVPDSQKRLRVLDESGRAVPDDRVLAGPLVVAP